MNRWWSIGMELHICRRPNGPLIALRICGGIGQLCPGAASPSCQMHGVHNSTRAIPFQPLEQSRVSTFSPRSTAYCGNQTPRKKCEQPYISPSSMLDSLAISAMGRYMVHAWRAITLFTQKTPSRTLVIPPIRHASISRISGIRTWSCLYACTILCADIVVAGRSSLVQIRAL